MLLAMVPIAHASTTSASPSSGYVAYSIQATGNGTQRNLSVNESLGPSSDPGKSILFLSVEATSSNFTYSHVVNSSLTVFPYMPAIGNESYTQTFKSYTVTAKITQQGTSQVSFQGKTYLLTNYAFSADIASANGSRSVNGTVSAFPSDLIYSFGMQSNDTRVSGTLTSTSLPLGATSTAPAVQAASAGLGLSLAGAAVALSLGIRAKRKHRPEDASKPDHWVD